MHQFDHRILAFDARAGRGWGILMGDGDRLDLTLLSADAQIAAIARVNRLSIATTHEYISLDSRV